MGNSLMGPLEFIGYTDELANLVRAWEQARLGNPTWVVIVGETGIGKTRLIQQFYRELSVRFDPDHYWPDELPAPRADGNLGYQLRLSPEANQFPSGNAPSIPWLWLALRGVDSLSPGCRENTCAAQVALPTLDIHLARYIEEELRRDEEKRIAKDVAKKAIALIPGVDTVMNVLELCQTGMPILRSVMKTERFDVQDKESERREALRTRLVRLTGMLLEHDPGIPLVLVLDDAQWLGETDDPETYGFVRELIEKVAARPLKLLIVSAAWEREWRGEEGAVRLLFEDFKTRFGHNGIELSRLGGISLDDARKQVAACFPGLSAPDVDLVAGKADGNFRYLNEICRWLSQDGQAGCFAGKDRQAGLSIAGRRVIRNELIGGQSGLEHLVESRYAQLASEIQDVLKRASYQGKQFDSNLVAAATSVESGNDRPTGVIVSLDRAENPNGFILSIRDLLREFQNGPYHSVVLKKLRTFDEEFAAVRDAYLAIAPSILSKATSELTVADARLLEEYSRVEKDEVDRIKVAAKLIDWNLSNGRYNESSRHLARIIEVLASSGGAGPVDLSGIAPDLAVVALKVVVSCGLNPPAELSIDPEEWAGWGAGLARALEKSIAAVMTAGDGLDPACLEEICSRAGMLVEFYRAFGCVHDEIRSLQTATRARSQLTDAVSASADEGFEATEDATDAIAEIALLTTRYLGLVIETNDDPDTLEACRSLLFQAHGRVQKIHPGPAQLCLAAMLELAFVRLINTCRERGISFEDERDPYVIYNVAADRLGNLTAPLWLLAASGSVLDEKIDEWLTPLSGNKPQVVNAYIVAVSLAQEESAHMGWPLSNLFTKWSVVVFMRLAELAAAETILSCRSVMCDLLDGLTAMLVRSHAVAVPVVTDLGVSSNEDDQFSDTEFSGDSVVAVADSVRAVSRALAESGGLSVNVLACRARADLACLWVQEAPDRSSVLSIFEQMLASAVTCSDGYRIFLCEPPRILECLVKLYDRCLRSSDGDGACWNRVEEAYKDAGVSLDEVVAGYRR